MEKEKYIHWAKIQHQLNTQEKPFHAKEGQIWMCHYGINIGHEQNGKGNNFSRPIFIIRKLNKDLFLTVPLTTAQPPEWCSFDLKEIKSLKKQSFLKVDQIRILDQKRLIRKIGAVPFKTLEKIQKKSGAFLLPQGR